MNRRRPAGDRADESAPAARGDEEQTRVQQAHPLDTIDDPPTIPSYDPRYDEPVVTLDPEDAVTWTDSMDDGWDAVPTHHRMRRPMEPLDVDDPPTVTNVTRSQRRRSAPALAAQAPAPLPPSVTPMQRGAPASAPRVEQPAPAPRDSSPWIFDEQSLSSTIQPGERRLLPSDVAPPPPRDPSQPSQPPSMAASFDDFEPSLAPEPAPELEPGERRLMPPDSVFPPPVTPGSLPPTHISAPPAPHKTGPLPQMTQPLGHESDVSQLLAAEPQPANPVVKLLIAVVLMVAVLAAVLWLLL